MSLGISMPCGFLGGVSVNWDPLKGTRWLVCVQLPGQGVTNVAKLGYMMKCRREEILYWALVELKMISWNQQFFCSECPMIDPWIKRIDPSWFCSSRIHPSCLSSCKEDRFFSLFFFQKCVETYLLALRKHQKKNAT